MSSFRTLSLSLRCLGKLCFLILPKYDDEYVEKIIHINIVLDVITKQDALFNYI